MRSLIRWFVAGLITWLMLWGTGELYKIIRNATEPVRQFLCDILGFKFLGAGFIITIAIVLISGLIIVSLGGLKSNIPGVSYLFGLTKMISGISQKIEKGKIKVVLMNDNNSYFLVFTTNAIEIINEKRFVVVFRPFTINITSGFTYFVPEEDFQKFPSLFGKRAVKLLVHGWLSKIKS